MRVEDWERVKVLFEAALEVPPEDRSAFLKNAGSGDDQLLSTVYSLLRNHTESQSCEQPRSSTCVFEAGDLVGSRFRVVRHINRGGMGEVYECFDEWLKSHVALKTMRPELLSSAEAVARFQREVRVARGVAHDNLCRLYEFLEHAMPDGRKIPCLTMEFIDGEPLSTYLQRCRPMTPAAALPVIRQIAAGLDTLHGRAILHRDLKPSNVMVEQRPDGSLRAVVMDFGLAKLANSEKEIFESSLQFQGGAPYFMSPEQLRGDRSTAASDIYAFGLLIDEMVTRSSAFSTGSLQSLYYAKLWEHPVSPRSRSDELPDQWDTVILRCLSQTPRERPASGMQVVQLLEAHRSWGAAKVGRLHSFLRSIHRRMYLALFVSVVLVSILAALSAPPIPLEVFEIANDTGDASYNYLCSGLTGEVVRRFSGVDGVDAIPLHETPSGPLKPRKRFTLDGHLRRAEGQVGLEMALHDSRRPGAPVWSRNFTATQIGYPLQVQKEIVEGIVSGLEHTLSWSTVPLRARRTVGLRLISGALRRVSAPAEHKDLSPKNNRALDDFMRGKQMAEQMSPDKVRTGIDLLQRSVAEDPSFALGYTALANANFTLMNWRSATPGKLLTDAKAFAQTAVTLDPNLAEAYEARALVFQHEWDWVHAREDYLRALHLKPSFALARRHYAILLTQIGEVEEGARQAQQAREDDPYDESALPGYGLILYIAGRAEEAIRVLERPAKDGMIAACHNLGEAYAVQALRSSGTMRVECFRKAIEQVEHLRQLESRSGRGIGNLKPGSDRLFAQIYLLQGDRVAAEPYFQKVRQELDMQLVSLPEVAWVYAAAGKTDEALTMLEEAVASRDRHLLFIKVYPFVDSLRGEPRFQKLLTQMHL